MYFKKYKTYKTKTTIYKYSTTKNTCKCIHKTYAYSAKYV